MVHRDIKPQNLMVTGMRSAESGVRSETESSTTNSALRTRHSALVKILDFGLARFASEAAADTGSSLPAADPGDLASSHHGLRHDDGNARLSRPGAIAQCATGRHPRRHLRLGCTLYFLLTGRPPFPEGSVPEKVKAHAQQPVPSLTRLRSDLPHGLEDVVKKMLAKDPAQRYQTPAEVVAALRPFLTPTAKKGRKLTAGAAVLFGVILAGIVIHLLTDNGTLIVDSPADRLEMVISDNESRQRTVPLQRGQTRIRLRSGAYEIDLRGSGMQQYEVSPEQIVIARATSTPIRITAKDVGTLTIKEVAQTAAALQRQQATKLDLPVRVDDSLISYRLIPAGEFQMGSSAEQARALQPEKSWFFARFVQQRREAETPQHRVEITRPFYLGAHEVTVGQFRKFVAATGYVTEAERNGRGYGWQGNGWSEGPGYNWQKPGFEQADRASGVQRELGRCHRLLPLAGQDRRRHTPATHRGRMGVRVPRWHDHALLHGR